MRSCEDKDIIAQQAQKQKKRVGNVADMRGKIYPGAPVLVDFFLLVPILNQAPFFLVAIQVLPAAACGSVYLRVVHS